MRRGVKPTKAKVEGKLPVAPKGPKNDDSRVDDLEKRLAEALKREADALEREREAQDQQAATSEILRVISSSPTDVQPVFEAMVRSARRLCDAAYSAVYRLDENIIHLVAHNHQKPEAFEEIKRAWPLPLTSTESVIAWAIREQTVVHMDVQADSRVPPGSLRRARALELRSMLVVPMVREGQSIGAIRVSRTEPTPFSDAQIALLKTFGDQAVIAIENVRLFNETKGALARQTATGDILRVIASSPTDVQPVFEAIVANSARLCDAVDSTILRVDGDKLVLVAHEGPIPSHPVGPFSALTPGRPSARAVLEARTIHVVDLQNEDDEYPEGSALARSFDFRTVLNVPLIHAGAAIGVIVIRRTEARPFTERQTELLETFADQAVIAIENVRLFKELQARNRDLTAALDKQMATSEILRVISQSQTDLQPVFDAIADNALRLFRARTAVVCRFDGELLHMGAQRGAAVRVPREQIQGVSYFPMRPSPELTVGRCALTRSVVHIADLQSDLGASAASRTVGSTQGWRSALAVPMMRDVQLAGVVMVTRAEPGAFHPNEIELLQTFADQAVIAIENVRLFKELQSSNRELRTALDTQTATSDILRVISRAQTDVQPVFDAIVASSVRLLGAYSGGLIRLAGDQLELVAHTSTDEAGDAAVRATFPRSFQSERVHAQAIRDRVPLNIADAHTDSRVSDVVRASARARGYRSWVSVPLLRHDEALGTIAVTRREPGGFTNDEIALLQTFADQAVIAIENARLLTELQARTQELTRSVEQLTALGDVGRTLSSTLDLDTVLQTIVTRASQLAGTEACSVFEYDEATEAFHLRATNNLDEEVVAVARRTPTRKGEGVQGRMAVTRQPVQIPDIAVADAYHGPLRDILLRTGTRAVLAIPMLREDQLIGGLTVNKKAPGEFSPEVIELLKTFATQSALAIQNARLFREIADKSRQLEVVSQHKSEFLANMSHELRTPLNAIIGFSEVLAEGMFGEVNEKQTEYLRDILESGQHLLSLINDILDLSKIEAGRMELELTDFDLPQAISNALTLVRERAGRRGIALHQAVDQRLGQIRGDERKIKQVLLNLLSNALKFTPEGGRVEVRAGVVDGMAEISVTDTGVGIAPEDQEAVFEEFRQVGTSDKKVEGTGLGLALSRKFIELHGGRIWVKSQVGSGSTFTFTLPVRRGE